MDRTGKWLIRELEDLDEQLNSNHAALLDTALRAAIASDPTSLIHHANTALNNAGGRLRDGYYRAAPSGEG